MENIDIIVVVVVVKGGGVRVHREREVFIEIKVFLPFNSPNVVLASSRIMA
jgi:hypothetical protein